MVGNCPIIISRKRIAVGRRYKLNSRRSKLNGRGFIVNIRRLILGIGSFIMVKRPIIYIKLGDRLFIVYSGQTVEPRRIISCARLIVVSCILHTHVLAKAVGAAKLLSAPATGVDDLLLEGGVQLTPRARAVSSRRGGDVGAVPGRLVLHGSREAVGALVFHLDGGRVLVRLERAGGLVGPGLGGEVQRKVRVPRHGVVEPEVAGGALHGARVLLRDRRLPVKGAGVPGEGPVRGELDEAVGALEGLPQVGQAVHAELARVPRIVAALGADVRAAAVCPQHVAPQQGLEAELLRAVGALEHL